MQNAEDFEKRIIGAKEEIAALLAGERTKEPGTILQAATRFCAKCQSTSAALKSTKRLTRKERAVFDAEVKVEEEAVLQKWAKKTGVFTEGPEFLYRYRERFFAAGAEQDVFLKEDGLTVIKVNTGVFHSTWLHFFLRLILHATLFPEVSYRLTGFTQSPNLFAAVIEQPWAQAARGASKQEVEGYLSEAGFTNTRYNDYYNKEHGLLLEDLHDENVLIGLNENILFIDPIIYLETPDLGLNGPSPFQFPF